MILGLMVIYHDSADMDVTHYLNRSSSRLEGNVFHMKKNSYQKRCFFSIFINKNKDILVVGVYVGSRHIDARTH